MKFQDRIKSLRRVRAGDLIPNPGNWRDHDSEQVSGLTAVLDAVGWSGAASAFETPDGLMLVDGHLRAEIDPDEKIPVLVLDVDKAESDILLATFDPIGAMATKDAEKLAALRAGIDTDHADLAGLLDDVAGLRPPDEDIDEVPPPPETAVTRPGDLWLLDRHRLLCGDSTDPAAVQRLLGKDVPELMVTDPPYGVNYDPEWRKMAGINNSDRMGAVANDDESDWTSAWRLFPGNVAYVWHGGLHAGSVSCSLGSAGLEVRAQIVWLKPRLVISRGHYHWQHEPAYVATREGADGATFEDLVVDDRPAEVAWYTVRKGSSAQWRGGRKQTTVWEIGFKGEEKTRHGTQKPVECMERPIRNHTAAGVYDPFLGSGTTMIAAERARRACYGMELSPIYCDVAVARWEKLTGKKAKRNLKK